MGSNLVTVDYDYNSAKQLSSILSPSGTRYNFIYDQFGRSTETRIGNTKLIENTYDAKGLLTSSTYGNNTVMNRAYDALNRLIGISRDTTKLFEYGYDGSGRISQVRDILAETLTKYEYDILDRAVGEKLIDTNTNKVINQFSVSYDNKNRVSGYSNNTQGVEKSIQYVYGSGHNQYADIVYGLILNGATVNNISYTYDALNRRTAKTINTTTPFVTEYTYMAGRTKGSTTDNSALTTTLIKTVKNGNDTLEYAYDNNGNITSIKKNGTVTASYTYDSLNQLKTETKGTDTWEYFYDNGGNILSVTLNGTEIKEYTYGNSEWKDLLTYYNGYTIAYDDIGNMTTGRLGYRFAWQNGRQLESITTSGGSNFTYYTYNADGIRTSKTVRGVKTEYILNGDSIICEIRNAGTATEYRIYYHYDESGNLVAFDYNNQTYYYIRNAQNDIIGIVDSTGAQVVSYEYDAWGNKLSIKDANGTDVSSNASHIANINPFRYRGYYYDSETSFYYLQSRYYAPEICRFINADGYVSTGQGILGHNMFAYCENNPVCFYDPTGHALIETIGVGGALVGAGILVLGAIAFIALIQNPPTIPDISFPKIEIRPKIELKSKTKDVAPAIPKNSSKKDTVIYRYGGTNPGNFVPSSKDAAQNSGLSFSTIPPPPGTKAAVTTIEALNATGVVRAYQDKPFHVRVDPVIGTLEDWRAGGAEHPCTIAVKSVVVKWDGGLNEQYK